MSSKQNYFQVIISGLSIVLLGLSSCATGPIEAMLPINKLESSEIGGGETQGEVGGYVLTGITGIHKAILSNDISNTAIDTHQVRSTPHYDWTYALGIAPLKRLEFSVHKADDCPAIFQAKYQFLGAIRNSSQAGNISVSGFAGYGQRSAPTLDDFLNDGTLYGYELKGKYYDLGILAGYRLNDYLLSYVGLEQAFYSYSGYQNFYNLSSFTTQNFEGFFADSKIHLGLEFDAGPKTPQNQNARFLGRFELSSARLRTDSQAKWESSAALMLGVQY